MATRRPKEPASDAPAKAWNEYDADVIRAFLDDAWSRVNVAPLPAKDARAAISWLRARVAPFVER